MNKQSITFTANEQTLEKTGGIENYASNIVSYVEATFTLGTNWTGYDVVRAVWESRYARISTVLDSNAKCLVPAEVLQHKSRVNVNLVGSIVEDDVLTDRLTTYPVHALTVDEDARVDSTETQPVTPSQFEQFVEIVHEDAESIQDYSYDSEAWAKGTRGGVAVPSTDPTYHNNSKYYADQGAELEQEVGDLKSDLVGIGEKCGYTLPSFTVTDGYMVNKNGVIAELAYGSYSSPIPVKAGDTVINEASGYYGEMCMIAICDSDGTNIATKAVSVDGTTKYEYTFEADGYCIVSYNHLFPHKITILNREDLEYNKSLVEEVGAYVGYRIPEYNTVARQAISKTGDITTS